jgi:hypothetical protein
MAWALIFDGVNDYATISNTLLHTEIGRTTFEYEIYAAPDADQTPFRVVGNAGAFTGQFSIRPSDVQIRLGGAGASQVTIPYVQVFDGLYHTYKIRRDGNNYSFIIDDIEVATTTSSAATGGNGVVYIGRVSGNYAHTNIGYIIFRDSIGGTDLFNWDATASSHAAGAPILTETVTANNATGSGFPTDGSAWVDLGGGGISIAMAESGPSFIESINTNLSVNITGAIVENGPSFTETVNATLTSLTIQANIAESGPSFTESISATLTETLTINADIAEQGPSFTEAIAASLDVNITSAITELGPSFTESININVIGDRIASIVESGPSFTEAITASIPITITVNPKNIIRVKRKDNTVIIKRKSNIIRVR